MSRHNWGPEPYTDYEPETPGRGHRRRGGPRSGQSGPEHHPGAEGRGGPHRHGGPERQGGPRGRRRGGRGRRGDVRIAVLTLLQEGPMHGYQLMQTITERTGGRWSPSPGAIYPTLSALEDEGLVTVTSQGGRKLVALTPDGTALVQEQSATWPDPFPAEDGVNLRELVDQVADATRQVGRVGTEAQRERAATLLISLRRELYLILAEDPEVGGSSGTDD